MTREMLAPHFLVPLPLPRRDFRGALSPTYNHLPQANSQHPHTISRIPTFNDLRHLSQSILSIKTYMAPPDSHPIPLTPCYQG